MRMLLGNMVSPYIGHLLKHMQTFKVNAVKGKSALLYNEHTLNQESSGVALSLFTSYQPVKPQASHSWLRILFSHLKKQW